MKKKESKQLDIFGNEIPLSKIESLSGPKRDKKKEAFRKAYGFNEAHTCDECVFHVVIANNGEYHKCLKLGLSHSRFTDICGSDKACLLFKEKGD